VYSSIAEEFRHVEGLINSEIIPLKKSPPKNHYIKNKDVEVIVVLTLLISGIKFNLITVTSLSPLAGRVLVISNIDGGVINNQ